MSTGRELDNLGIHEMMVRGRLDSMWSDWFDGFSSEPSPNSKTVLRGQVTDQAALHGVLSKIRDLGMLMLSVKVISMDVIPPLPGPHYAEASGQERQPRMHAGGRHDWPLSA